MITAARILLGLAALTTLLVAVLVSDAHPVRGADAIGLVVVLLVLVVQWFLLVGPVFIAARRGALAWLHSSNLGQALAALVWLTGAGVTASAAVVMAYGPNSDIMVPWAFVLAVGVPAIVIAGLALSVREGTLSAGAARPARLGAVALTLLVAVGAVRMLRLELAAEREVQAAIAVQEQEREQFDTARRAAFEALPPTAPLQDWLPWLQLSDETGRRAVAAVRARPTVEQDVAAMLRSDDAAEALRFMWLWMPDVRSTLAEPALDAMATLPE